MNPKKIAKKLKTEKRKVKKYFKSGFRKLVGSMFSQISKDSKYTQIGMKEGVRRHGDRALDALLFELTQLDEKETFQPLLASSMTNEECKMALNLLTIIKEKDVVRYKAE